MKIEIKHRYTNAVLWSGDAEDLKAGMEAAVTAGANLDGARLVGANLDGANLVGARLDGANLDGANLDGARLDGAKGYGQNHDILAQLIRNNLIKFTVHEQEMVFRIFALRLCWDSIEKEYGKRIGKVFSKLAKLGWDEYEKEWLARRGRT